MFIEIHTPEKLDGKELDSYLERGWFRRGPAIFTTHFANLDNQLLSAIWLRVKLLEYGPEKIHKKLLKKNARFSMQIEQASVTEEKEELYTRYRVSRPFEPTENLQLLLFGKEKIKSVYTTNEVTIRDNNKLIGCCYFDLGKKSSQAVVSFYDPDYKNFSLGKFLIYSKLQFCKELGHEYFYPGYFIPGNRLFQYKTDIGRNALQYLNYETNTWQDYEFFTDNNIPSNVMRINLEKLQRHLSDSSNDIPLMKYEFFDVGLYPYLRKAKVLDFPLFLLLGGVISEPAKNIVVFDVKRKVFVLLLCKSIEKAEESNPDPLFYSSYIMKPIKELYVSSDVLLMSAKIIEMIQNSIPASQL